jgi:hypothetical protein
VDLNDSNHEERRKNMPFKEFLYEDRDLGRIIDAVESMWESPASGGNWSSSDFSS